MPPTTDQLRGWKEIAAYLKASERSAKRWEKTRGLPVRRLPGTSRDGVFAVPEEIEAWARGGSTEVAPTPSGDPAAAVSSRDSREERSGDGRSIRIPYTMAIVIVSLLGATVLALVGFYAWRVPLAFNTRRVESGQTKGARVTGKGGPGPSVVVFHVATAHSVARVSIVDGGCGAVALSGHPFIDLCPRLIGDGLFLDVFKRGDGRTPGEKQVTLRLDPNSEVRVPGPVWFDVEWVETTRAATTPTH